MTIKFSRRIASELLKRGESSIRISPSGLDEAKKAMTRDDVRTLIKNGGVYAIKKKHNVSMSSKLLKIRRKKGRGRGQGRRKGTLKARRGERWIKQVRSQRLLLSRLKLSGKLDNISFNKYYMLVKGNSFPDKASLILHIREDGIKITDEEINAIKEYAKSQYK